MANPSVMAPKDFVAIADQYAQDVLDGRQLACEWLVAACERYLGDRQRALDPANPWTFDALKASRPCKFIELLPLSKGSWAHNKQNFVLQPWQVWLVVNIFGFVFPTGYRRFRHAMILIPRKNGKSELAAAIALYMFAMDGEHSAEVYSGATSEKQAYMVFTPAKTMVKMTSSLAQASGIQVNASSLSILRNGSKFEPIIGKPGDGSSPSCAIVDEYHEHPDSSLKDTMITGMGARKQPLLLVITTAGNDVSRPCFNDVLVGRSIVAGIQDDDRMFYAEWSINEGMDWRTIDALKMANPNYEVSTFEEHLLAQQKKAVTQTCEQNLFKSKHLNLWVSAKSAYHNMVDWNSCYQGSLQLDQFRGHEAYVGLDLASKNDIAAMIVVIPLSDGYAVFPYFYLPEETVERASNSSYSSWAQEGKIISTAGSATDYDEIMSDLDDIRRVVTVKEVVFDPMQATYFSQHVMKKGVTTIEFNQNASNYSEPMREACALMQSGKLHHNCESNHPMSWQMSNVVSRTNRKDQDYPDKTRPELKIDGAVALYMALARIMANYVPKTSVYEERGFRVFG